MRTLSVTSSVYIVVYGIIHTKQHTIAASDTHFGKIAAKMNTETLFFPSHLLKLLSEFSRFLEINFPSGSTN